jgi:lipoate-protein ligase A
MAVCPARMDHPGSPIAGTAWGLLPRLAADGERQMALDRWMLAAVGQQGLPPALLRFYTWKSPTVSLGRHQRLAPASVPPGLAVVVRPSGGSAVLHGGDLCYALALATPPQGQRRSYVATTRWLQQAMNRLERQLQPGSAPQAAGQPHCFATATAADLLDEGGDKRIGSAQLWSRGRLLQHGSIQLQPPVELWRQLFGDDPPPPHAWPLAASTLADHLEAAAAVDLFGRQPLDLPLPAPDESGRAAMLRAMEARENPIG